MIYGTLYLLSIVCANILVIYFGIISIGPLDVPAGAVVVGITFTLRDIVQQVYGKFKCWWWMISAALISALFSPTVALASVSAFLISEAIDWLIFSTVKGSARKRSILSNVFGTPLDSLVFVPMVFGWVWPAIIGQAVVKLVSSLVVVFIVFRDKK
jgi:hypothetical protein